MRSTMLRIPTLEKAQFVTVTGIIFINPGNPFKHKAGFYGC
jgi:hypothetical protein